MLALKSKSKEDLGKLLQEINANIGRVVNNIQENRSNDQERRELAGKLLDLQNKQKSVEGHLQNLIEAEKQESPRPVAEKKEKKSEGDRRRIEREEKKALIRTPH